MIREFSVLGYPGSLEEEIRKYIDFKNRDILFDIAKTEDEIKYLRKRIQLASTENTNNVKEKYLSEYIEEIESDAISLEQKLDVLRKQIINPEWETGILRLSEMKLKTSL